MGPSVHAVEDVRPIQIDYPDQTQKAGGQTIVLWSAGGSFEEFQISLDGGVPLVTLPGTLTSVRLGDLDVGQHLVTVAGLNGGVEESAAGAAIDVLPAPVVAGVLPDLCIFYAYEANRGGLLDVFWTNRDDPAMPYVDLDIIVDGVFQRTIRAPDDGLSFSGVPLGVHEVEVVAYTWNYITDPGEFRCNAEEVLPVSDPVCRLDGCENGAARFLIDYTLPPGPLPEAVAIFDVTAGWPGILLGRYPPGLPLPLGGVAPGSTVKAELITYRGDSASIVPSVPGAHVLVTCSAPPDACNPPPTFRRGDCDGDGAVALADDILGISHLFSGDPLPCADACDLNDDGSIDISDPIAGLSLKFRSGPSPPPPYPDCGVDPTDEQPDLGCNGPSGCP